MTAAEFRDMAGLSGDTRPAKGISIVEASIASRNSQPVSGIVSSLDLPGASASGVLSFVLPLPPSLNGAFRNGDGKRGRFKTAPYRQWIAHARMQLASNRNRIAGPFDASLSLPEKMRGDIDNRIKPILDLLVSVGIVDDDRHCQSIFVRRAPGLLDTQCVVTVREATSFDAPSQRVGGPKSLHGLSHHSHAGTEAASSY